MSTFISEPGTRLGGRYRLEDRVDASSGWSAWKAIDETLARPVAVLTFAPGFPRIPEVATAARAASRLTDARLVQVFDVEDNFDQAYVVMEWVASDSLHDLLAEGPLEPGRSAEIIAEGADALASAHAAGLAHLCLTPGSLRWSQVGGVKIAGVGIDAALTGVTANDPALADTLGLGRLLYAALTAHWPGTDWPGLPPAPEIDGRPRAPHQVCAGVPAALDDITCQALFQREQRNGGPPPATPAMLAAALAAFIPAPSLPPPAAPPRGRGGHRRGYDAGHATGYGTGRDSTARGGAARGGTAWGGTPWDGTGQDGTAGDGTAGGPMRSTGYGTGYRGGYGPDTEGVGPGPGYWDSGGIAGGGSAVPPPRARRRDSRSARRGILIAAAAAVVLLALVLALRSLVSGSRPASAHGGKAASSPSPASKVTVLTPVGASGFDALSPPSKDAGNENSDQARNAIDGNPRTAWQTQYYFGNPVFGGLKRGTGLILDMGSPVRLSSVQVTFGPVPGADVRIEIGNDNARAPATLRTFTPVASADNVSGTYTFQAHGTATGRYVLIWFTRLPPRTPGSHQQFQAEIFGIVVRGSR